MHFQGGSHKTLKGSVTVKVKNPLLPWNYLLPSLVRLPPPPCSLPLPPTLLPSLPSSLPSFLPSFSLLHYSLSFFPFLQLVNQFTNYFVANFSIFFISSLTQLFFFPIWCRVKRLGNNEDRRVEMRGSKHDRKPESCGSDLGTKVLVLPSFLPHFSFLPLLVKVVAAFTKQNEKKRKKEKGKWKSEEIVEA